MLYVKADDEISEFDGVDILIFPLQKEELEMLKKDQQEFAEYINLNYEGTDFSSQNIQAVYQNQHKLLCEHPENWVFYTFWTVVSLSQRTIVGCVNFKDVPNASGEVEIGFYTNKKHENQGYATLAVELLGNFARNNNIKKLIANIESTNIQALKVLEKNNFRIVRKTQNGLSLEKGIF